MKGDIALAGFVLTQEEWLALDAVTRAQLVAAATTPEVDLVVRSGNGQSEGGERGTWEA